MTFRSLVVPLDGSPFGEQALPLAVAIAQRARSAMKLVLAHQPPRPPMSRETARLFTKVELAIRKDERAYLRSVAARVKDSAGVRISTITLTGSVTSTLPEYVAESGADLVVMTTHGRGPLKRAWLGSVADHLIRNVAVPVLLVRPREDVATNAPEPSIAQILVPLDGSPLAEAILEPAGALAQLFGAELRLAQLVKPVVLFTQPPSAYATYSAQLTTICRREAQDYLDSLAAALRTDALRVTGAASTSANVAETVLDLARSPSVGMIALATHGYGGMRRTFLGSVADKVIRGSDRPVLVYRPPRSARRKAR